MTLTCDLSSALCPGCHFRCKLARYQCGRGKRLYDIVAAGGELPSRQGPTRILSSDASTDAAAGAALLNSRVLHGLSGVVKLVQGLHDSSDDRNPVLLLARSESFMCLPLLARRMQVKVSEIDAALDQAVQAGLIAVELDERVGNIACLTAAGAVEAAQLKAQRDARNEAFLSALSADEKETLVFLLRKLRGKQ